MRVVLEPPPWATHLVSDLTDWRKAPLPVAELSQFELPDDAYFEYAWQDAAGERHPDPGNSNPRLNPWWKYASHLTGPRYEPDPWLNDGGGRPRGRVLRLEIPAGSFGAGRPILVYSPPGHADSALPTIYFQDGKAYFGWGRVCQVFDRLQDAGLVAAAHLVFITPQSRTAEYAFNDDYLAYVVDEILPRVEERAPSLGRRTAWGASLGGLCSAHLAWTYSELFGRVVSQSGAYLFSPDMDYEFPFAGGESFRRRVVAEEPRPIAWHLECGTLEWLTESNRSLFETLRGRGMSATLRLRSAGHNWVNWRNGLAEGLQFAISRPSRGSTIDRT